MQRQMKAKSLSVKIPKNGPTTVRLNCVLANEEFLMLELPRYALERFMVQAKRAIEGAPLRALERIAAFRNVEEACYSKAPHLARRLAGPAPEGVRECADLMKAEQPRNLGHVQVAVIEVANGQIAPQLLKYVGEIQPLV